MCVDRMPWRTSSPASRIAAVMTMLPRIAWAMKASLMRRGRPCVMARATPSLRRLRNVRDPIAGRLHGVQQLLVERLVDGLAQVVEMAAQRVGIGQAVAPDLALDLLAADHAR